MRKEGNRNIPERFRLSFSSPYLSFPIYRFQKINLIRVRTPRARRISFTLHRCGLSTTSRRPSSLPPSLWRASHTGGRRVEFVSRRLFPVDLLALANLSKGERRGEGIRVVRGYELVESKSYGLLSPWIRPISTRSTFPPIGDFFFFISAPPLLVVFSKSSSSDVRVYLGFTSVSRYGTGGGIVSPSSPESRFPSFEKKTRIKSVEVDEISTMSFSLFFLEFFLYIDKNRSRLEGGEVGGPSSSHWKGLGRGLILIFALCEYSRGGRGEESRSGGGE